MSTLWIIEDHTAFRRTLVRVLNTESGLQCTRDFDPCEKALAAMVKPDLPDLILLDVGLPGTDREVVHHRADLNRVD